MLKRFQTRLSRRATSEAVEAIDPQPDASRPAPGSALGLPSEPGDDENALLIAEAVSQEARAQLLAAEYAGLRAEIGRYQDHQRQLINSVFIVIGGSLAIAGKFTSGAIGSVVTAPHLLICVPPIYALLGLLYLDRAVRIIRLAHYLHDRARPIAAQISGLPLWEWETYKRETGIVSRRAALLLDKVRWGVFILPLLITTGLDASLPHVSWLYRVSAIVVGVISFMVTVVAAAMTEETTGVGAMTGSIE